MPSLKCAFLVTRASVILITAIFLCEMLNTLNRTPVWMRFQGDPPSSFFTPTSLAAPCGKLSYRNPWAFTICVATEVLQTPVSSQSKHCLLPTTEVQQTRPKESEDFG